MKYVYYLFSIILAIVISGSVCYAQRVVLEQIPWTYTADKESDPRLAQKIDYEAWHTPLKTIFADLAKKAGVELHAGYSNQDWQVRDRKMNVYVKGIALGDLMDSISRVMNFKWTQKGEKAASTYTLNADRKLLTKIQAEADRRANELAQEVTKRRTEMIDSFDKVSKLSDSDLEKLKQKDPYLYMCSETGFAQFVTQMLGEFKGLKGMVINGSNDIQIPYNSLSKSSQALYCSVLREYEKYAKITRGDDPLPKDLEQKMPGCTLQWYMMTPYWEGSQREQLSYFGSIGSPVHIDGRAYHHKVGYFCYPSAKSTQDSASVLMTALGKEKDAQNFYYSELSKLDDPADADKKAAEYFLMYDPVVENPADEELSKEIEIKFTEEMLNSIKATTKVLGDMAYSRLYYQMFQKSIADALKMNVVSDSYAVVLGGGEPGSKEEAAKVLAKLCKGYQCNYEKHGTILELRRRDWFRRRTSQIPDEMVKEWKNEAEKNNILSLDTYAEIVTLTLEQVEENISSDKLMEQAIGIWWEHYDTEGLMRFYLQLNPMQRRLVFSEDGLDTSMLNKDQLKYYKAMFQCGQRMAWWESQEFGDMSNPALIKASKKVAGKKELEILDETGGIQYTFNVTVDIDGTTKADHWTIHIPQLNTAAETTAAAK